jgi:hypothetical protein
VDLDVVDRLTVEVEVSDVTIALLLELPELDAGRERRQNGTGLVARRDNGEPREVLVDVGAGDFDEVVASEGDDREDLLCERVVRKGTDDQVQLTRETRDARVDCERCALIGRRDHDARRLDRAGERVVGKEQDLGRGVGDAIEADRSGCRVALDNLARERDRLGNGGPDGAA